MAFSAAISSSRSMPGDIHKLSVSSVRPATHPPYLSHLASTILYNLQHQHDWTSLSVHTHSPLTGLLLPRPLVSGLPPRRVYVHPDEQAEIIKAEHISGTPLVQPPEQEWILPSHVAEKWSLEKFAAVFDAINIVPPTEKRSDTEFVYDGYIDQSQVGQDWRGKERQKRLLLATLHNDSTVVYYILHDGIVKPRQH